MEQVSQLLRLAREHRSSGQIKDAEERFVAAILLMEKDLNKYWQLIIEIESECQQMLYEHRFSKG